MGSGGGKRRGNNTHSGKPSVSAPSMPQMPSQKPGYSAQPATEPATVGTVPPGFTPQQWQQLQQLAKSNPTVAQLLQQYAAAAGGNPKPDIGYVGGTTSPGGGAAGQSWRRTLPTDTTQLLRQLSYNAGEMPMPGGYVGAVQLPSYGSSAKPVNNPDMSKYGQAPGLGEATFYQQSMQGGMAPIAALKPVGVPSNWNPGGAGSGNNTLLTQLQSYLNGLNQGGVGGSNMTMEERLKREVRRQGKADAGVGGMHWNMDSIWQAIFGGSDFPWKNGGQSGGGGGGSGGGGNGTGWPGVGQPGPDPNGGMWRGKGSPIKLPFGF